MKSSVAETCCRLFSTLSNLTSLAILEHLKEARSVRAKQIVKSLGQEQSMILHNLKPLIECGFAFAEDKWKERVYSLNKETMEPMFKLSNFHAQKYCPTKGACLKDWRNRPDKFGSTYIRHH